MIGIVDFGGGNVASVGYALDHLGAHWRTARSAGELELADAVIFPGVGAAGAAMARLRRAGLDSALRGFLESGRPYLGICLGLQVLFEASSEGGGACLGVLPGRVTRLRTPEKLPHVGWNTIHVDRGCRRLAELDRASFYFTHSYVVEPEGDLARATSWHGTEFVSAVETGNLLGVQFHPERSGEAGLQLLASFLAGVGGAGDAG